MSGIAVERADLARIALEVARGLATASMFDGRAFIQTPVLFPSGSAVVVTIEAVDEQFLVSDLGQGYDAAELAGVERAYRHEAVEVARKAGVAFDRHAFFVADVGRERLPGAVITIADCAKRTIERALLHTAVRRSTSRAERLGTRLDKLFTPRKVRHHEELFGASMTQWNVDALVVLENRRVAFDLVGAHPNSVATATAKFHDLARLDEPLGRVAVVASREALGTRLALVAQAATVIEDEAPDAVFERVALAA